MPSISSILSIASGALRTQQQALEVTSHNIANAATDGYARQRPELGPNPALVRPEGVIGTGVRLAHVGSTRDGLAEASYRDAVSDEARHGARRDLAMRIENALNEPGDTGMSAALDRFFSAWSDLSADPASMAPRRLVVEAGQGVADELGRLAGMLDTVSADATASLTSAVARVNELAGELAGLNRRIATAEAGGGMANDLRDERVRALDELASLVPVEAFEQANGSLRVTVDGYGLVDGLDHRTLEAVVDPTGASVRPTGWPNDIALTSGAAAGYVDVLDRDIPTLRSGLDDLAAALVADVNAIHRTGTNPAGNTGVDFFDPAGVTAASIALAPGVAGSPAEVAAGTGSTDPTPQYRAGAQDVALQLAALRSGDLSGIGTPAGEHVTTLVTSVGTTVRSASEAASAHEVLVHRAEVRRESAAGVSVDEEMVQLIRFQSAYGAAARVVTTADEMLETLLRM